MGCVGGGRRSRGGGTRDRRRGTPRAWRGRRVVPVHDLGGGRSVGGGAEGHPEQAAGSVAGATAARFFVPLCRPVLPVGRADAGRRRPGRLYATATTRGGGWPRRRRCRWHAVRIGGGWGAPTSGGVVPFPATGAVIGVPARRHGGPSLFAHLAWGTPLFARPAAAGAATRRARRRGARAAHPGPRRGAEHGVFPAGGAAQPVSGVFGRGLSVPSVAAGHGEGAGARAPRRGGPGWPRWDRRWRRRCGCERRQWGWGRRKGGDRSDAICASQDGRLRDRRPCPGCEPAAA